ncbi:MAG TPA: biopolymer transporter ExbD [Bdellovibrionales bacterium]|nr:biopolymer transporter ExbD [Bdellovibrionales bacterium]
MAHIDDGGDERSKTVDLNLVPIIDLMSVCIIFLLITAVWTQVSMIQIGSSIYGKKSTDEKAEPPPKAEIPFRLDVQRDGYRVIIGRQTLKFPKIAGEYDQPKLTAELKKIKELYPDKVDAVVTVLDDLPYGSLIGGMDALLTAGFPEISVATAGAAP